MMVGRDARPASIPTRAADAGAPVLERRAGCRATAPSATSRFERARRRDPRASAAWSAAAAPRSRACCSASTGRPRATIRIDGQPVRVRVARARPWRRASPMSPRTASARAWSWTSPSSTTPSLPVLDQATRGGPRHAGARARPGRGRISSGCGCASGSYDQPVKTLSGGNQQKVVLSQMARAPGRAC